MERDCFLLVLVPNNSLEINRQKGDKKWKKRGKYIYRGGKRVERRTLTSPGQGKRLNSPCSCPELLIEINSQYEKEIGRGKRGKYIFIKGEKTQK